MMPRTHIIVVTHKNVDDLQCLFHSLRNLIDTDWHLSVIDNSPSSFWGADPNEKLRAKLGPEFDGFYSLQGALGANARATIYLGNENKGFGNANNIGAEIALRDNECQYLWFLNPDVHVDKMAEIQLREVLQIDTSIGLVGSTLLNWPQDGQFVINEATSVQGAWVSFSTKTTRGHQNGSGQVLRDINKISNADVSQGYVIGASIMMDVATYKAVGGFDESYFLYFEELDLSQSLKALGLNISWAKKSYVFHKEGSSIGSSRAKNPSVLSCFHMSRSMMIFYRKNLFGYLPVALARIGFNALRELIIRKRAKAAFAVFRGLFSGLTADIKGRL